MIGIILLNFALTLLFSKIRDAVALPKQLLSRKYAVRDRHIYTI